MTRQADVADPAAVKALFDAHDEAYCGVDVVVNNAGIMNVGPFAQMTDDAFNRMIATNMTGEFQCSARGDTAHSRRRQDRQSELEHQSPEARIYGCLRSH